MSTILKLLTSLAAAPATTAGMSEKVLRSAENFLKIRTAAEVANF